jgi:hypothetical protein
VIHWKRIGIDRSVVGTLSNGTISEGIVLDGILSEVEEYRREQLIVKFKKLKKQSE